MSKYNADYRQWWNIMVGCERPTPSQCWAAIGEKCKNYATAKMGDKYVKILGVIERGTLSIYHPTFGPMHAGVHELCWFVL